MSTWVELCAGWAACALRIIGGPRLVAPVAWMGSKRRLAPDILAAMGVGTQAVSRIVLVDPGPWGWVWPLLFETDKAEAVARVLDRWQGHDPRWLWDKLASKPPAEALHDRAAQWLWLQARAASGVPIWWGPDADEQGWRMGEEAQKARRMTRTLGQCGGGYLMGSENGRPGQPIGQRLQWPNRWSSGGVVNPATIATRIRCIADARAKWGGVLEVIHKGAEWLDPAAQGGGHVYIDPPYVKRTGYGWTFSRDQVLDTAAAWARWGWVVAVSEAEPLPPESLRLVMGNGPEWHHLELVEGEWLTMSREPAAVPAKQMSLLGTGTPIGRITDTGGG